MSAKGRSMWLPEACSVQLSYTNTRTSCRDTDPGYRCSKYATFTPDGRVVAKVSVANGDMYYDDYYHGTYTFDRESKQVRYELTCKSESLGWVVRMGKANPLAEPEHGVLELTTDQNGKLHLVQCKE